MPFFIRLQYLFWNSAVFLLITLYFVGTIAFYALIPTSILTIIWDTLAWLTANEDVWRNTGFRVPIISCIVSILLYGASFPINSAIYEARNEIKYLDSKSARPKKHSREYLDWANRTGKYDD